MGTPDAAPRRVASQTGLSTTTGEPVPGANPQTYIRKAASSDGMAEGKTYMSQRSAGKTGVGPTTFPDTKASK